MSTKSKYFLIILGLDYMITFPYGQSKSGWGRGM